MAAGPPLAAADVQALRAALTRFGTGARAAKAAALAACAGRSLDDPDALVAYHDALLFGLAHPETAALRNAAAVELVRVAGAAAAIAARGPARRAARLDNSGLANTALTIGFGWDIARWLVAGFPAQAEIDGFADAGAAPATVLQHLLPAAEFELLAADEPDALAFIDRASAGRRGTRLQWLVGAIERLPAPDGLREQLFDSLQPYVTIRPGTTMLSRTFIRGLAAPTHFHRAPFERDVDLQAAIGAPLPPPRALSARDRRHVLDAGRAMLAALGRETDAIAASSPAGVAWHDLPRGAALALYTMQPARRGAFDSHVGFMLFKNGLPVGYGGGWPFLGTCKIGINIFAPYRGGESAWLFAQVLRVYARRFAVERFVAEPSQIGYRSPEGLASGAYWFYYRLGFRSADPRLAAIAEDEQARMTAQPGYRTPVATLRRFTRADLELPLPHRDWTGERAGCDPADLSLAVTAHIAGRHRGNRAAALAVATRDVARALGVRDLARWPESERRAFAELALLYALIPGLDRWPPRDRREAIAVMRAKGGDEFAYFDRLQRHRRLRPALEAIAAAQR